MFLSSTRSVFLSPFMSVLIYSHASSLHFLASTYDFHYYYFLLVICSLNFSLATTFNFDDAGHLCKFQLWLNGILLSYTILFFRKVIKTFLHPLLDKCRLFGWEAPCTVNTYLEVLSIVFNLLLWHLIITAP